MKNIFLSVCGVGFEITISEIKKEEAEFLIENKDCSGECIKLNGKEFSYKDLVNVVHLNGAELVKNTNLNINVDNKNIINTNLNDINTYSNDGECYNVFQDVFGFISSVVDYIPENDKTYLISVKREKGIFNEITTKDLDFDQKKCFVEIACLERFGFGKIITNISYNGIGADTSTRKVCFDQYVYINGELIHLEK